MEISIVVDDKKSEEPGNIFLNEHGSSFLIKGKSVTLFDTGSSDILLHNMKSVDITPGDIDKVIISHGHYDHTGGLMFILQNRKKELPVYVHHRAFVNKVKKDFPILNKIKNNYSLIYFDNAATTQKSKTMIDAILDFYMNHKLAGHLNILQFFTKTLSELNININ